MRMTIFSNLNCGLAISRNYLKLSVQQVKDGEFGFRVAGF